MENEFKTINGCMESIKRITSSITSSITSMKNKISKIDSVVDKKQYIQQSMSFSIDGCNFTLCKATQSGTEIKRGSEMVMLGIKKMLNAELSELEEILIRSKEALVLNTEKVKG